MGLTLEKQTTKPPRIVIYSKHGMGKSTFGSYAPNPIFIQTEDGLETIKGDRFPLASSYQQVMGYIQELCEEEHQYKTLVIDTLDWLEPMVWQQVCSEYGVDNIEKVMKGYGKGYLFASDVFKEFLDALNYLRNEREMIIICIAHAEIKKYENPETEAYDRYNIKLHKRSSDLFLEWADAVFFLNDYVATTKEDVGFNKERKRAIGSGERILYTEERPIATAKNRYNLPKEINFDREGKYWDVLNEHIPFLKQKNNKEK